MSTAPHLWRLLLEARRAGARLVVVDPARSRTARVADEHLRPLPGSDGALAMGMMRAVLDAGLADEAWCREHAEGFDALVARVGERTVEEWASLCGVPAEDVERIGREFASTDAGAAAARGGRPAPPGRTGRLLHGRLPAGPDRRLAPRRRRLLVHPHRHGGRRRLRAPFGATTCARARSARSTCPSSATRSPTPRWTRPSPRWWCWSSNPAQVAPAAGAGAGGAAARGPVLRGARAVHDRHRRARRRGAAGHHPARAHRRGVLVGPPLPDLQRGGDRAAGRGALELRHLPGDRRADGARRSRASRRPTRRSWRGCSSPRRRE